MHCERVLLPFLCLVAIVASTLPPLITLEEHFLADAASNDTLAEFAAQFNQTPGLEAKMRDLGSLRLKDMDAGQVCLQIISHVPTLDGPTLEASISINNQLFAAVSQNRTRFAGFATLPMADPQDAIQELERCVSQLGFVGALIDCHANGTFYDGEEYLPFWSKVQELQIPVYIHPTWPATSWASQFEGNYGQGAIHGLGTSGWGWHSATALHILRLFASGLFDKMPNLKILIGHFGEMLPFMLERDLEMSTRWGTFQRDFVTVYRQNIWITTSGVWSLDPLATVLRNTPIDHILYSVDYPIVANEDGLNWMLALQNSSMVTEDELEMIAWKNAGNLLGVKVY